ncbi:hypothetical protein BT63DRAFT_424449 [Microthyrium microscopicum]|uniref:Uncharacterized protein n=1 Tax=Microthyrium microscopicum TaxID=703497 RepID=A0A6A6UFU4_9PEZI|nr:hypothetical protein BT63DRAFT_424449 [Microthyrium microscopicum]
MERVICLVRRCIAYRDLQIPKLLETADHCNRLSEDFAQYRDRRDQAYIEYAIAYDLVMQKLLRTPGYADMVTGNISLCKITFSNDIQWNQNNYVSHRT